MKVTIRDGHEPEVGDIIVCDQDFAVILGVSSYGPGEHPDSPIRDSLPARAYITERGSRWTGIDPDGHPVFTPLTYREE